MCLSRSLTALQAAFLAFAGLPGCGGCGGAGVPDASTLHGDTGTAPDARFHELDASTLVPDDSGTGRDSGAPCSPDVRRATIPLPPLEHLGPTGSLPFVMGFDNIVLVGRFDANPLAGPMLRFVVADARFGTVMFSADVTGIDNIISIRVDPAGWTLLAADGLVPSLVRLSSDGSRPLSVAISAAHDGDVPVDLTGAGIPIPGGFLAVGETVETPPVHVLVRILDDGSTAAMDLPAFLADGTMTMADAEPGIVHMLAFTPGPGVASAIYVVAVDTSTWPFGVRTTQIDTAQVARGVVSPTPSGLVVAYPFCRVGEPCALGGGNQLVNFKWIADDLSTTATWTEDLGALEGIPFGVAGGFPNQVLAIQVDRDPTAGFLAATTAPEAGAVSHDFVPVADRVDGDWGGGLHARAVWTSGSGTTFLAFVRGDVQVLSFECGATP